MKSERNNQNKIQVRIGTIAHNSYLFFPRELGDLLLEPGDEIILVSKSKYRYQGSSRISFEGRKGIFYKIRKHLITEEAAHKLVNRTFDAFGCLKDAINEYYIKNLKVANSGEFN